MLLQRLHVVHYLDSFKNHLVMKTRSAVFLFDSIMVSIGHRSREDTKGALNSAAFPKVEPNSGIVGAQSTADHDLDLQAFFFLTLPETNIAPNIDGFQ